MADTPRRRWTSSAGAILAFCACLVALPTGAAFTRIDPPSPDYLTGYLTWTGSTRTISWDPESTSDDLVRPNGPDPTRTTWNQAGYYLGYGEAFTGTHAGSLPSFEFTSAPLRQSWDLNASRLIQVNFILQGAQSTYNIYACDPSQHSFDVSIYADGDLIAGGMGYRWNNASTRGNADIEWPGNVLDVPPGGYCALSYRLQSEVSRLEAGAVLKLRVVPVFTGDYQLGLRDNHRSHISFPFYSAEESVYRLSEAAWPTDEPASDTADASGAALLGLAALAGLALAPRRRRLPVWLTLLVVAPLFAGCFGAKHAVPDGADETPGNFGGSLNQTLANGTVGGAGVGSLLGLLIDDLGRPVSGGHVALLRTGHFANVDSHGRFKILNITEGDYTLRVDRDGFKVFESEEPVKIRAGKATYLEVHLEPLVARGEGGFRPHSHPYWTGPTKQLMDQVSVGRSTTSSGYLWSPVPFTLPPPESPDDYRSILPGTSSIEVKVEWTGVFETAALHVVVPPDRISDGQSTISYFGNNVVNETPMLARRSGEPFRIATNWETTDPGHQHFSDFMFAIVPVIKDGVSQSAAAPTAWKDGVEFRVSMTITKGGRLPLEPAHPDFWGANRTYAVGQGTVLTPVCVSVLLVCTTVPGYGPITPTYVGGVTNRTWIPPNLVPPDTEWLSFKLRQQRAYTTYGTLWEWKLSYHTAESYHGGCPADVGSSVVAQALATHPVRDADGLGWEWRIPLGPADSDPFYAKFTSWCFWLSTDAEDQTLTTVDGWGDTAIGGKGQDLTLNVTAYRDPLP